MVKVTFNFLQCNKKEYSKCVDTFAILTKGSSIESGGSYNKCFLLHHSLKNLQTKLKQFSFQNGDSLPCHSNCHIGN